MSSIILGPGVTLVNKMYKYFAITALRFYLGGRKTIEKTTLKFIQILLTSIRKIKQTNMIENDC